MNTNIITKLIEKINKLYSEISHLSGNIHATGEYNAAKQAFEDAVGEVHDQGAMVKFDWSVEGIRYFPAINEDGKENFTFVLTKTMRGHVIVSADSEEEAKAKALAMLQNGEVRMSDPLYSAKCSSTCAE